MSVKNSAFAVTSRRGLGRQLFLILCFSIFLCPISFESESGSYSVNYSFLLCPLAYALLSGRIRKPPNIFLQFMAFYMLIFVFASLYQYQLILEWPRRAMSFLLFMSMFAFMFMRIDDRMVEAFKAAIIITAIYSSLYAMGVFLSLGDRALDSELAKTIVGTQRIGFIYLMAFWLLYMATPRYIVGRLLRHVSTFVVLIGLALTFSRSSIVALAASLVAFAVWSPKWRGRLSTYHFPKTIAIIGLVLLATFLLIQTFFPIILQFFEDKLLKFLFDREAIHNDLSKQETSFGTRMFIWQNIIEYLVYNPLTGSGFLGVWTLDLFNDMSGSAHNQYLDVLFRVGIVGFLIYIFLLYRTAGYLRLREPGLYWGLVGALVYGLFHETFKESQGGFLLAFLLGMMSQSFLLSKQGLAISRPACLSPNRVPIGSSG